MGADRLDAAGRRRPTRRGARAALGKSRPRHRRPDHQPQRERAGWQHDDQGNEDAPEAEHLSRRRDCGLAEPASRRGDRTVRRAWCPGFDDRRFIFSYQSDHTRPCSPSGVSHRYARMVGKLGIQTRLHATRHFSATELLASGVDLRTVAGRLGHGSGGAATLKVYAAWVARADPQASELLAARLRTPRTPSWSTARCTRHSAGLRRGIRQERPGS